MAAAYAERFGMYKVGDMVVYGTEGLCEICDISEKSFGKETMTYYVLCPVNKGGETVYVPAGNEKILSRMRHILTREGADELISSVAGQSFPWIENERERQKKYKEILLCGSARDILMMTSSIYFYQIKQQEIGKKLHAADERFFKDAEKMLFEELAYIYEIEVGDVLGKIAAIMGEKGQA